LVAHWSFVVAEPSNFDKKSGATISRRLKIPALAINEYRPGLLVCLMRRRDPIELEIFKNLYHSIAEEMGAALRRTAFSPNIKERRDYSCAVFDGGGQVIAMGVRRDGSLEPMPGKFSTRLRKGERIRIETPSGGGYGRV
jgi:hypothetical protein